MIVTASAAHQGNCSVWLPRRTFSARWCQPWFAHRAVWPRKRRGLWSNAGVFVRVWEYEVPGDRAAAFAAAYAPDGAWGQLFGRAAGFLGTELYRDVARDDRYLTIDRWQDEQDPDQPVRH